VVSNEVALAVVRYCLAENRYFPEEALVTLVKLHCLSHSRCPELFAAAAAAADRQALLHACTMHLHGMDESAVVTCIGTLHVRAAAGSGEGHPTAPTAAAEMEVEADGEQRGETALDAATETELAAYLRHVFSRSWDESKVIVALQGLGVDAVYAIIQALQRWMLLHADNQQEALCIAGFHGSVATSVSAPVV
jgi:hypothetical protein